MKANYNVTGAARKALVSKILLKNLSGNSSWKNGAPDKETTTCE